MFTIDLPVAGLEVFWPAVILLGACIGCLTGLFGVGGGFLLTPCLKFLIGVPFPVAVGSDLAQIFVTGSYSTYRHNKRGNVDAKLGVVLAAGAIAGTFVGAALLQWLKTQAPPVTIAGSEQPAVDLVLSALFVALMCIVGVAILRETGKAADQGEEEADTSLARALRRLGLAPVLAFPRSRIHRLSLWVPMGLACAVGVLTGLLGVGGGFVMFPLLVYLIGAPTAVAVGTSAFQIMCATAYGATDHYFKGNVDLVLVALLLAGSIAGARFGVWAHHRLGGRRIRRYFAAILALGVAVVVIGLLNQILSGGPAPTH